MCSSDLRIDASYPAKCESFCERSAKFIVAPRHPEATPHCIHGTPERWNTKPSDVQPKNHVLELNLSSCNGLPLVAIPRVTHQTRREIVDAPVLADPIAGLPGHGGTPRVVALLAAAVVVVSALRAKPIARHPLRRQRFPRSTPGAEHRPWPGGIVQ